MSDDRCFPEDPVVALPPAAANEAALVLKEVQDVLVERPAERGPVAFDLDDTVVTGLTRTTRQPGEVPTTRHALAWVLGRVLEGEERVLIVTGREEEEEAWADLVRALEEVCKGPLEPHLLERITMACGGAWAGTRIAVTRKVRALREEKAVLLVGDLDHLDGRAAREAGIPFIDVGPKHTARRLA